MTVPSSTIWEIEPHTIAKHEILRLYLQRWFPILNTYHGRMIYVDGFCGPGRYKDGEPGSPLVVLNLAANHIKTLSGEMIFWFIDERKDRMDHLKQELRTATLPANFKIQTDTGRFHEKFQTMLDEQESLGVRLAPTFIFLDPFGFAGRSIVTLLIESAYCGTFIKINSKRQHNLFVTLRCETGKTE